MDLDTLADKNRSALIGFLKNIHRKAGMDVPSTLGVKAEAFEYEGIGTVSMSREMRESRIRNERSPYPPRSTALSEMEHVEKTVMDAGGWLEAALQGKAREFGFRDREFPYSETCTECQGDKKTSCRGCGGAGQANCTSCRNGKTTCPRFDCHNGYNKCTGCHGLGTIQVKTSDPQSSQMVSKICPSCSGSKKGYACVSCKGSGELLCGSCRGTTRVTCAPCGGDGHIKCSGCYADGFTSTAFSLTMGPSTKFSYLGPEGERVNEYLELDAGFRDQIRTSSLAVGKSWYEGDMGKFKFSSYASVAYVRHGSEYCICGSVEKPPTFTANFFETLTGNFVGYVESGDIDELNKSEFGREILSVVKGDPDVEKSLLSYIDATGSLNDPIKALTARTDKTLMSGERFNEIVFLIIMGILTIPIHTLPILNIMAGTGVDLAYAKVTDRSFWIDMCSTILVLFPIVGCWIFKRERNRLRKLRSIQVLGAERKFPRENGFKLMGKVMLVQFVFLLPGMLIEHPIYPQSCSRNDSLAEVASCIGGEHLGKVIGFMTPLQLRNNTGYPFLGEVGAYLSERR